MFCPYGSRYAVPFYFFLIHNHSDDFYHNYSFYPQPVLFLPRLSLYHESPQILDKPEPLSGFFLDSRCYTGLQNDQKGQKHSMNHTADTSQYKYDIEQLLATGHPIRIKPQGVQYVSSFLFRGVMKRSLNLSPRTNYTGMMWHSTAVTGESLSFTGSAV